MSEQTAKSGPHVNALSPLELTGRAATHVQRVAELDCVLHPQAASALLALRAAARHDGIEVQPVSGFRDFERQLKIWNGKFSGARELLSAENLPMRATELSETERVRAILIWSALPGASRHHWGSDCDLIDRRALEPGARVELSSADYAPGGRYARLSAWLAAHARNYGFFLPYDRDRGGVQPEPWHLSFAPVSGPALASMSCELLAEALGDADLAGRAAVMAQLPQMYERYVTAVTTPPAAALVASEISRGARLV